MKRTTWGGARPGAGRRKTNPAALAARNSDYARRQTKRAEDTGMAYAAVLNARLADAGLPPGASADDVACYRRISDTRLERAWRERGREVLVRWIAARPGTRPTCWWAFDAPRLPRAFLEQYPTWGEWVLTDCHIPRLMVGGSGRPVEHDPRAKVGFPIHWLVVDAGDPPRFESQAAYLKRHKLLVPGEAARLRSDDLYPEILPREFWPHDTRGKTP